MATDPWADFEEVTPSRIIPGSLTPTQLAAEERARRAEERAERAERRAAISEGREGERFEQTQEDRDSGRDASAEERKAGFLATRLAGGIDDIRAVLRRNRSAALPEVGATIAGILGQTARNLANSEDRQRIENAELDILDAALTLGTGAAYTPVQLQGYRQSYFPQIGDSEGTIADKQRRLDRLLEAAMISAGRSAPRIQEAMSRLTGGTDTANDVREAVERARTTGVAMSGGGQEVATDFAWTDEQRRQIQDFVTRARSPQEIEEFARNLSQGRASIGNAPEVLDAYRRSGNIGPVTDVPSQPTQFGTTPAGQTLSGVNEGIASTLGAPVDLLNSGLSAGAQLINGAAGTNLHASDRPFGGSAAWRSILTGAGAIAPETDSAGQQFMRRVGQSVGSAAIPLAGAYSTLPRALAGLGTAAGGGVGAATANQVAPGSVLAEVAGETLGSIGSGAGLFAGASRQARNRAEAAVPTTQQLRNQASNLYRTAEERGVVGGPNVTSNMAGRVQEIARRNEVMDEAGTFSPLYPEAQEAVRVTGRYAGDNINPTQIQVIREGLADAAHRGEGRQGKIAREMLSAFDAETIPLAPELGDARRTASRYLQAGNIERASDLAEARAGQFAQSGMENALRTEFRNLDRQIIRGDNRFNPATTQAIQDVARGTPSSNAWRFLGKLAPSSPFAGLPGLGLGASAGAMAGDPVLGAVATGTLWGGGMFGRAMANRATNRGVQLADLTARNGGPISVEPVLTPELMQMLGLTTAAQVKNAGF